MQWSSTPSMHLEHWSDGAVPVGVVIKQNLNFISKRGYLHNKECLLKADMWCSIYFYIFQNKLPLYSISIEVAKWLTQNILKAQDGILEMIWSHPPSNVGFFSVSHNKI